MSKSKFVLKTVFGEEIKVGDKLMYIYKSHGTELICFGEVMNIEYKETPLYSRSMPAITVRKTYEIDGTRKTPYDKKVILTNPTAFKCGQELKFME